MLYSKQYGVISFQLKYTAHRQSRSNLTLLSVQNAPPVHFFQNDGLNRYDSGTAVQQYSYEISLRNRFNQFCQDRTSPPFSPELRPWSTPSRHRSIPLQFMYELFFRTFYRKKAVRGFSRPRVKNPGYKSLRFIVYRNKVRRNISKKTPLSSEECTTPNAKPNIDTIETMDAFKTRRELVQQQHRVSHVITAKSFHLNVVRAAVRLLLPLEQLCWGCIAGRSLIENPVVESTCVGSALQWYQAFLFF